MKNISATVEHFLQSLFLFCSVLQTATMIQEQCELSPSIWSHPWLNLQAIRTYFLSIIVSLYISILSSKLLLLSFYSPEYKITKTIQWWQINLQISVSQWNKNFFSLKSDGSESELNLLHLVALLSEIGSPQGRSESWKITREVFKGQDWKLFISPLPTLYWPKFSHVDKTQLCVEVWEMLSSCVPRKRK